MTDSLFIVPISLCCSLLIHIAVSWVTPARRFLLKGLAVGVAGSLLLAVVRSKGESPWLVEAYIYFTAWIFYLMAFMNLLNSVTLKMLSLLYAAPQCTLEKESLETVLDDRNGFDTRFDLLTKNGLIETEQEALKLTRQAKILVSMIWCTRRLLGTDAKPRNRLD